jgi:hypothetical protein
MKTVVYETHYKVSTASSYFLSFRSKYSPQRPVHNRRRRGVIYFTCKVGYPGYNNRHPGGVSFISILLTPRR